MGCQDVQRCAHWAHCDVTYELTFFACDLNVPQFLEDCGAPTPLVWRDGRIEGDDLHHGVSTGEAELSSAFLLIVALLQS